MKYIFFILVLVVFTGCSQKEPVNEVVVGKYWNLCVDANNSNLLDYKDQPLYFKNSSAYFFNKRLAIYSFSNDTLVICDTSYYDKRVINNGIRYEGKVNITFHKIVRNDSLFRVTNKFFVGKVLKANSDSLIIDKIEGYGLPFKYQDQYKFYNDTLLYDLNLNVDTIEFSSSLCYGKCPAIAMKIDKNLNYYCWGGNFAHKQGYFQGKVSQEQFDKLENLIRIANIMNNETGFAPPIDAPHIELIIDYNGSKTKLFCGFLRDYPPRIRNIGIEMLNLYDNSNLDTCNRELEFSVRLDVPRARPNEPPPPPPPPSGVNASNIE